MNYDVISIGSLNIDAFLKSTSKYVEFEHIHTHDDVCFPIGAKILVDHCCTEIGGSAVNSALSLSRLGFKTGILGKLGNDLNADVILDELKKRKVAFLGKRAPGSTGYSVILSGLNNDRTILVHKGNNNAFTELPKKLNTKWLYFGTMLGKSFKTQCRLAQYARKNGIKILYNPSLYLAEKRV